MKKSLYLIIGISIALLASTGCSTSTPENMSQNGSGDLEDINNPMSTFDVNKYALNKLICDPFNPGDTGEDFQSGLHAELFYLTDDQPRYMDVHQYIENGTKSENSLFFSSINVPTRLFDQGFPLETGGVVKTDEGEVLNEYFALKFKTNLRLADDQAEGLYQIALLSDDGAIMKIKQGDSWDIVVDNNGIHPTKMGCGQTIEMKVGESIEIEILYYQGPKYHISAIPLWRKDTGQGVDSQCGKSGNSMYFDYNNNSEPQQSYLDLLDRGWAPISANNYFVPVETEFNPCVGSDIPEISQASAYVNEQNQIVIEWMTDIPATSQVMHTNDINSQEVLTNSDNILRTNHQVFIDDPIIGATYGVKAISVSANLGKSMSEEISVYIPVVDID